MSLLNWLCWGVASIALLNLVTLASLVGAYVWHHRLKPTFTYRRARQHAFEQLIAHTSIDNHPTIPVSSNASE
jgi:hypothetical protein